METVMNFPKSIALIGGIITLFLFIIKAITHRATLYDAQSFLFADKELTREGIANNLSATASSLATALLFIILKAPDYGFIIFVVVFLFWGGHRWFMNIVGKLDPSPLATGSIYRFLSSSLKSSYIAIFVNLIVVFSFLILLVIELVLGATIFEIFIPNIPYSSLFLMLGIGLFAFIYVLIGGFKTVAFSDGWQFKLLYAAVVVALTQLIINYSYSENSIVQIFKIFKAPQGGLYIWGIFLLNAIVVNLTLPTCQISSWQRFSSSASPQEFIEGYKKSLSLKNPKDSFIYVWILFVIFSVLINQIFGSMNSLGAVFSSVSSTGILGAYLVFPLLFIGLLAALLSTADSLLISLLLGIDDFATETINPNSSNKSSKIAGAKYIFYTIFILIFSSAIFFVLKQFEGTWSTKIVSLMFLGVGLATIIFPLLFSVAKNPNSHFRNEFLPVVGLLCALVVYVFFGFFGIAKDKLWIVQLAPVISMPIMYIFVKFGKLEEI